MSVAIGPTGPGELSTRLAAILHRYRRLVDALTPRLTVAQWAAVVDANNGTDVFGDQDFGGSAMIWANVEDSPGLGEKWSVDPDALVRSLKSMSTAELIAVTEVCRRFWQSAGTDEGQSDGVADAVLAAGAKIGG